MDFRWGTITSLRTVMKPHMKKRVVTIDKTRWFVPVPATAADVSDLGDIELLFPQVPPARRIGSQASSITSRVAVGNQHTNDGTNFSSGRKDGPTRSYSGSTRS